MKNNDFYGKCVIVGFAAFTLVASGTTGTTAANTGVTDTSGYNTLGEAHADKLTFSARAPGVSITENKTLVLDSTGEPVNVTKNAAGNYDILWKGKTYALTRFESSGAKATYTFKVSDTETIVLASLSEAFAGFIDYNHAELVMLANVDAATADKKPTNGTELGFVSLGIKTEMPPTDKSVTYKGGATAFIMDNDVDGFSKVYGGEDNYNGDLTLVADFSTNKISGSISGLNKGVDADIDVPGSIAINSGSIVESGYSATLTGDAAINGYFGDTIVGGLSGNVYGADADETSGTFYISTDKYSGIGGYIAKER